tara:strand:- start:695 stop:955 length:261 start_codon:yes stop_codon:yes gene_type:complete
MYKVTTQHILTDEEGIVKAYLLNGIPFTFDCIDDEMQNDQAVLAEVIDSPVMTIELIHQKSAYLLEEGLHPMLSGIELDPESILPE